MRQLRVRGIKSAAPIVNWMRPAGKQCAISSTAKTLSCEARVMLSSDPLAAEPQLIRKQQLSCCIQEQREPESHRTNWADSAQTTRKNSGPLALYRCSLLRLP